MTALKLNVNFSDEGVTSGQTTKFGDLKLKDTNTFYDGQTIRQILNASEIALGGGSGDISVLNSLVTNLNESMDNGMPSGWAMLHLTP